MRIGVVAHLSGSGGGGYQYGLAILHAMEGWVDRTGYPDELVLATDDVTHPVAANLREKGWSIVAMPQWARRIAGVGSAGRLFRRLLGDKVAWELYRRLRPMDLDAAAVRPAARDWMASIGAEMMLYTAATPLSFWGGVPYVMAIHDLQHRLNPRFPEVSANGQWEGRERLYRNGSRLAVRLLADSEVGREDILEAYGVFGVTEDKVKVLPFVPPPYLKEVRPEDIRRVRAMYGLPDQYFFYPAQIWPHKNHRRIVEALGLLRQRQGLRIHVVFCGSNSGSLRAKTFREVAALSRQVGVEDETHYLGYVADSDMAALYSGAVALLMPTFFGPTNIPVLEAWQCNCPVITSNIRGIREQVGDAAFLVDPESAESIADAISGLWTDTSLRRSLVDKGRRRLALNTEEEFNERLVAILEEARALVLSTAT